MSLRLRLALAYFLVAAPLLAGFSLLIYFIASAKIYRDVDASLTARSQAGNVALELVAGPISGGDIDRSRRALDRLAATGAIFQVRDIAGGVLYSSRQLEGELAGTADVPPDKGFSTRVIAGQRTRVLIEPVVRLGQVVGLVEAREPLVLADQSVSTLRRALILGGVVVLAASGAPAYVIAGGALQPVRRVSQLAKEIEETADFSRRLPGRVPGGEMEELTATFNAMTERVEQLISSQRAFLADTSHELRRPLMVLRANVDVINDPALTPQERQTVEREMRIEVDSMSRLVSDLLVLSREGVQPLKSEPVDLSTLCGRALDATKAAHRQHVLHSDIQPGVEVEGDQEGLAQLLENLLENASLYTPASGRVDLRLSLAGDHARLEVSDNGMGFSEEDLAHAFDRFYRGSSARAARVRGSGLGLAIVKYVAEAHGGGVTISSKPAQGTTVTVIIPASHDAPRTP